MRFVEEETDASGVCVELLSCIVDNRGPPLASDLGWLLGKGGGWIAGGAMVVGVEPRETADRADTFNGCCGRADRGGLGPGFGGGRCFNILIDWVSFS